MPILLKLCEEFARTNGYDRSIVIDLVAVMSKELEKKLCHCLAVCCPKAPKPLKIIFEIISWLTFVIDQRYKW